MLLLTSVAASAQTPPTAPAADPDIAREDVVVESVATRITFDEGGQRTASVAATLRVNTPAGVQQAGTLTIPFRRDAGTVAVDYVRVRKPDGSVVETPAGASFDLPAPITQQAPVYSDLYLKHINVQALQPGDRLEYRWQVEEPSLVPGHFWATYDFDALSPARQTLEVSWPASRRPIVKSLGPPPTMATDDARITYRWQSTATDAIEADAADSGLPDVQISSFRDWADVGTVVRDLWRGRADVTTEIRARALELTAGITDTEQKARALYRYVATSVRYVAVEMGVGRIQPNPASVVLANGFGDCKDKHILLEALLRAVGIEARPVLINPGVDVDADVPSIGAFSHVVTLIEDALPAPVWLDTTLEVAPFGFLVATERNATVLPIAPAGEVLLVTTPAAAARGNVWRTETTGTLSIDGRLEATVRETLSGDLEVLMRSAFRAAPRQNWEQVVRALPLAQARSAAVTDLVVSPPDDTDAPFTLEYRYIVDAFVDWGGGDLRPPDIIVPEAVLASADGEDAVNLGMAAELVSVSRIELPDGVEVSGTPLAVDLGNDLVRYQFRWAMKDRVVETERRLASLADEIPVAGLPEYRAFRNAVRESPTTISVRRLKPWAWNDAPTIEWYRGAGPSAVEALQAASAMGRRGDYQASIAASSRLLDADPDNDAAWQMLAWAQFTGGSHERALATMRRRVPLVATPSLIKYYADRLMSLGRHTEAADVWRLGRQRFPDDREIPLYLGATLIRVGQPAEAVEVLRSQGDVQRESARYHMVLGDALLAAGDTAAATAALLRSAEIDDSADHLNRVAWQLGDNAIALDEALRLAGQAVTETTAEINDLTLTEVGVPQLELLPALTSYWDTLGWIHFRRGEFDEARRYLEAAWQLAEVPAIAQHLSELYTTVKDPAAERLRTFADAASRTASNRARLANDGGERARVLADARNDLERVRTFALPREIGMARSQDVLMAVAADGSVRDALVLGGGGGPGNDELVAALESMTIPWSAPDVAIAQTIRRGTVSCVPAANQCTLVLQPVGSATGAIARP